MNARKLITLTTFIITLCLVPAGKLPPSTTFSGAWASVQAKWGPGATGGTLTFSADTDNEKRARLALSADATPITGSISIPDLRNGTFETRAVSGYITPKGRVRAKFKGGFFNGRLDRGNHGATGFILVNMRGNQWVGFWYADTPDIKD
jgi:hypothetical protein